MVFANFSAVVPEFKVKFGTLVSSSILHLTAFNLTKLLTFYRGHLAIFAHSKMFALQNHY